MSDNRKYGTTTRFHLPYPTSDTPIYSTPKILCALAESIESALICLDQRITAQENRKAGVADPKVVAKAIKDALDEEIAKDNMAKLAAEIEAISERAAQSTALVAKVTENGDLRITAPELSREDALRALNSAIIAEESRERVKQRIRKGRDNE